MSAEEVVAVVHWLESRRATYQVNGGWAVDALLGHQTRGHRDLDVFVDQSVVDELLEWLEGRSYSITEDWRPVRVELSGTCGTVDVHPMEIQPNGDGIQRNFTGGMPFIHSAADRTTGRVAGHTITVATVDRLIELRRGYEPRAIDHHDLTLLNGLRQTL